MQTRDRNATRIRIALSLAGVLTIGGAGHASAALNAYLRLSVDGAVVQGCVTLEGRIDTFEVTAFGHTLTRPHDAATGIPTGRQEHKPVTMRLDKSTVLYFKALASELGMPYQSLINLYLRDCALHHKKLQIKWAS